MFEDYPWLKWVVLLSLMLVVAYVGFRVMGSGGGVPDPMILGYVQSLKNPMVSGTEYKGDSSFTIDLDPLAEQSTGEDTRESLEARARPIAQQIADDCKTQTGRSVTVIVRVQSTRLLSVQSQ